MDRKARQKVKEKERKKPLLFRLLCLLFFSLLFVCLCLPRWDGVNEDQCKKGRRLERYAGVEDEADEEKDDEQEEAEKRTQCEAPKHEEGRAIKESTILGEKQGKREKTKGAKERRSKRVRMMGMI